MRSTRFVAALIVWAAPGLVQIAAAQTAPGLTIHNVTLAQQVSDQQQQLREQQAVIADLQARLARLESRR